MEVFPEEFVFCFFLFPFLCLFFVLFLFSLSSKVVTADLEIGGGGLQAFTVHFRENVF